MPFYYGFIRTGHPIEKNQYIELYCLVKKDIIRHQSWTNIGSVNQLLRMLCYKVVSNRTASLAYLFFIAILGWLTFLVELGANYICCPSP